MTLNKSPSGQEEMLLVMLNFHCCARCQEREGRLLPSPYFVISRENVLRSDYVHATLVVQGYFLCKLYSVATFLLSMMMQT